MKRNPWRHAEDRQLLEPPKRWSDLIGRTFGRLLVLGYTGTRNKHQQKLITTRCACGFYLDVLPNRLTSGSTTSCGCFFAEQVKGRNVDVTKHGHARGHTLTPEYRAWSGMISRCHNSNDKRYKWYGARGIAVCDEWRRSFSAFLATVGLRPSRLFTLERVDNDRGYEPGNVVWATAKQQARNQRSTRWYEFEGQQMTLGRLADQFAISYDLLRKRVEVFGWTVHDAVNRRPGKGGRTPTQRKTPRERVYMVWHMIRDRCHNPSARRYADYGGRGITLCDEWKDSFEAFYAAVGDPPPDKTIDRIDNDRGYEPGNVRWATSIEQVRNRRNTKLYELNGERNTLAEWAALADLPYARVRQRVLTYNWPLDEALGTPVTGGGRMAKADRVRWIWTPP